MITLPKGEKQSDPVILRKYENRKIYCPTSRTYRTLANLRLLLKSGKEIRVIDWETKIKSSNYYKGDLMQGSMVMQ